MASTTLMPLDPALSPQRVTRILSIAAHLLPDDVVAGRRARQRRSWVIVSLVVVVALLSGWYIAAVHTLDVATDELGQTTAAATQQQKLQLKHQDVVQVQRQTVALDTQLKTLMANDLSFAILLNTVRDTGAAAGVTVTGISAGLTQQSGPGATGNLQQQQQELPNANGRTIGSVTITGTAPDKPSVARYVDRLGALTIVSNPYLTNASNTDQSKNWSFSVAVDISATAACGRFTTTCTGGK